MEGLYYATHALKRRTWDLGLYYSESHDQLGQELIVIRFDSAADKLAYEQLLEPLKLSDTNNWENPV